MTGETIIMSQLLELRVGCAIMDKTLVPNVNKVARICIIHNGSGCDRFIQRKVPVCSDDVRKIA
ncbi:Uncharacterised protein [Mycobacteroides abscessus subsp. abscessus]|nr:Uncharacterised protein [Mycobacteroides abscessus subsp. abscessus]